MHKVVKQFSDNFEQSAATKFCFLSVRKSQLVQI